MARRNKKTPNNQQADDRGISTAKSSFEKGINESNPQLIDLGHNHRGAPFIKEHGWLPKLPKQHQWRWYAIINTLLRGRWVTQREMFIIAEQNNPGGPIHYIRSKLEWPILLCPWKRPAHLHDETDETTRSDMYYLPQIFIDYFFSLMDKHNWERLVPGKAKVSKNIGCFPTDNQRKKAEEFLQHKIEMFKKGGPRSKLDERREDDWFARNQKGMDPNEGHDFGSFSERH